ncbi:PilZ domain-containing protein [Limisalsivibrio acetivorans]|uniref:PilZ domain-containing protein n=1 Tax=Limisalsivibrio acetivorans TaxID=1304888 RepID=UPI0003B5C532|nr:PilZ domain-containing protein [Limisalsivibrio acetivorans]
MLRARLTLTYPDDIKTAHGQLVSKAPPELKLQSVSENMLKEADEISMQWHENGRNRSVLLNFVSIQDGTARFKAAGEAPSYPSQSHRVEYKGIFDIKVLSSSEIPEYRRLAERENAKHKTSIVNKIKNIIPNESVSNQHLFRMLLEMDSKLDEILFHVAEQEMSPETRPVKALYLSGEGIGLFTEDEIKKGESLYVRSRPSGTGGKLRFSTIAEVARSRSTEKGYLLDALFIDFDEAVRENVIKFIFEKDRELIKGTG